MADHPITPPPELVEQWHDDWLKAKVKHANFDEYISTKAARWGADQELEACCEWLGQNCGRWELPAALRAARRPEPPSLKEQALEAFEKCWNDGYLKANQADVIRRALEQLDD